MEPQTQGHRRGRFRPSPLLVLAFIIAVFVVWAFVAEALWRSGAASDDDAVMPPTPPPAEPVRPPADPGPDPTGAGSRGQSSVRGDGTALHGATVDTEPATRAQ